MYIRPLLSTLVVLATSACGVSAVTEQRMVAAPGRPADCELNFVQLDMMDMVPGAKFEVLGYVQLQKTGTQDAFSDENRAKVHPRACAMGGEAVGIVMQGTTQMSMFGATGSGVTYAVVRTRLAPGASATPQKF